MQQEQGSQLQGVGAFTLVTDKQPDTAQPPDLNSISGPSPALLLLEPPRGTEAADPETFFHATLCSELLTQDQHSQGQGPCR